MYRKKTVYIASPLFSQAELEFNIRIREVLEPHFRTYLPQEDGELLNDTVQSGGDISAAIMRIFLCDIEAIKKCDILLMVLDGRTIDEGAAFELGVAFALGKICFGLQTDPRRLLPVGNNPMISCPLDYIFSSLNELQEWVISKPELHKSSLTEYQQK